MHNKCNALLSHPKTIPTSLPQVCRKIVFHKTILVRKRLWTVVLKY